MEKGKYIIFEGGEGSGKGTQISLFSDWLAEKEIHHLPTKEPGGTSIGKKIEQILKHSKKDLSSLIELLLFCGDRTAQYEMVTEFLSQGDWVVSDRSWPSTFAYQGAAGKVPKEVIQSLNNLATNGRKPDLLYIIDVDPKIGLGLETNPDRFAAKGLSYHQKVREGYLQIAKENPDFAVVIPYIENNPDKMQEQIRQIARERFGI